MANHIRRRQLRVGRNTTCFNNMTRCKRFTATRCHSTAHLDTVDVRIVREFHLQLWRQEVQAHRSAITKRRSRAASPCLRLRGCRVHGVSVVCAVTHDGITEIIGAHGVVCDDVIVAVGGLKQQPCGRRSVLHTLGDKLCDADGLNLIRRACTSNIDAKTSMAPINTPSEVFKMSRNSRTWRVHVRVKRDRELVRVVRCPSTVCVDQRNHERDQYAARQRLTGEACVQALQRHRQQQRVDPSAKLWKAL